jgi:uncharacterized OB-fold protein
MEVPRHWRTQKSRYSLVGVVCGRCQRKLFPPRDVCTACGSTAVSPFQFSGRGRVYSYSMVYQAPMGFTEYAPYAVGLVELEEGPLVACQLADVQPDMLCIGMEVEMVTRKLFEDGRDGIIVYGYKFRPVKETAAS